MVGDYCFAYAQAVPTNFMGCAKRPPEKTTLLSVHDVGEEKERMGETATLPRVLGLTGKVNETTPIG
jgi:hypothetical protein